MAKNKKQNKKNKQNKSVLVKKVAPEEAKKPWWKRFWVWGGALLSALAFIGGLISDVFKPLKEVIAPPQAWQCEQDKNIRGVILDFPPSISNVVYIDYGSREGAYITLNKLNKLYVPVFLNEKAPIIIEITERGEMLVSARIHDINGCLIAVIERNQFLMNLNCLLSYNLDKKGFELVDENFNVVFNIDYKEKILNINGILRTETMIITMLHDQKLFGYEPISDSSIKMGLEMKKTITPIFKYTGNSWFGQRAF